MYLSICLNIGRYSGFPPNQCLPIILHANLKLTWMRRTHDGICASPIFKQPRHRDSGFSYWLTQKRITAAGTAQVFHLIPFHAERAAPVYAARTLSLPNSRQR